MGDIANKGRCACNGMQLFHGQEEPAHHQHRGHALQHPSGTGQCAGTIRKSCQFPFYVFCRVPADTCWNCIPAMMLQLCEICSWFVKERELKQTGNVAMYFVSY